MREIVFDIEPPKEHPCEAGRKQRFSMLLRPLLPTSIKKRPRNFELIPSDLRHRGCLREMDPVIAIPLGCQLENPRPTQSINSHEDLIPRQVRAFEYDFIERNTWRTENDLQYSIIHRNVSWHGPSGEMVMNRRGWLDTGQRSSPLPLPLLMRRLRMGDVWWRKRSASIDLQPTTLRQSSEQETACRLEDHGEAGEA